MKKWNIGWGTISRCNMNCQFCYSKHKRIISKELKLKDWIKFIDENHQRINSINYGTGENTLDKDWFKLISHIRKNYPDIRQALTTNGHLSKAVEDQECLKAFVDAIDEVDVSLDFCDKEKHNQFRGQPKSYDWALNTLQLCKTYKKPTTIVFLGSNKNLDIENIKGLFNVARKYDTILRMNMYRPTEGINEHSKQFIVEYEKFVDTLKYISENEKIISLNDALFSSILTNETVDDPSGDRSIRILPDGSITPSTYLIENKYIVANIVESNVLEKIEKDESLTNIIQKKIPNECKGCVYEKTCAGGVFDRRYLWYGTLDKKDPYCPQKYLKKNKNILLVKKDGFKSVHDGYLPTIFFRPMKK